jgi:hypothetical protein
MSLPNGYGQPFTIPIEGSITLTPGEYTVLPTPTIPAVVPSRVEPASASTEYPLPPTGGRLASLDAKRP